MRPIDEYDDENEDILNESNIKQLNTPNKKSGNGDFEEDAEDDMEDDMEDEQELIDDLEQDQQLAEEAEDEEEDDADDDDGDDDVVGAEDENNDNPEEDKINDLEKNSDIFVDADKDVDMDASKENTTIDGENDNQLAFDGESDKMSLAQENVFKYHNKLYHSASIATSYNINPNVAIPVSTQVQAMALSKGLKYLFLGGDDGFIRKYDLLNSIEGKLSLTILQKHSLVDSISNAGILTSYWPNEIPQFKSDVEVIANKKTGNEYLPKLSPVTSLDVHSECMFLLSGHQNGGISLQGVRYREGTIAHYFSPSETNGHNNIVNMLKLSNDEKRFFSASWDQNILEWDLNAGKIINRYESESSQISSLEFRPINSTVELNAVNSALDADSDDDMDSLFGDESEAEDSKHDEAPAKKTLEEKTAHSEKSTSFKSTINKTTLRENYDENSFLTSKINGQCLLWDRRASAKPVLELMRGKDVPPWANSATWSADGDRVYVGRRNACVEEFDLRKGGSEPSQTLRLPSISGPVSCVKALPNNRHVVCASNDNIRVYDSQSHMESVKRPFLIIPGHHGGVISNLYVDPTCRYMVSTSGNKNWQGISTDVTFVYDIDLEM